MKHEFIKYNNRLCRVLQKEDNNCLLIYCDGVTMPFWMKADGLRELSAEEIIESKEIERLLAVSSIALDETQMAIANRRFTMIADILPVIGNAKERLTAIKAAQEKYGVSVTTIKTHLSRFLIWQSKNGLVNINDSKMQTEEKPLSQTQKNMRWALNKFYYTTKKNSLKYAYTNLLKEKYCDASGNLLDEYPSFYQFRYFYRTTRDVRNEIISRKGLSYYQRNERPCVGDGVQSFAKNVGMGMLDSTVCDIYLINEAKEIVGRPLLTACVDAYSGVCMGYSLGWEGGVYSLRNLMFNVISDKRKWCHKFGIDIADDEWNCHELPAELVTDKGSEYKSENFEQLAELGITITNLPPYRPELKGPVEKFFDIVQGYFKPYLKGCGVIQPDYGERGATDYRKEACLTMEQFETILIRCIIFYNSKRTLEDFPYSEAMLNEEIKPYASHIWNYGKRQAGANLLSVTSKQLTMTLLPRTSGEFSRFGLKVGKLHYKNEKYESLYFTKQRVTVAYNPDNVSEVYLLLGGQYILFELVESRYKDKSYESVYELRIKQGELLKGEQENKTQAEIKLAMQIQNITQIAKAGMGQNLTATEIKGIRKTRQKEVKRSHLDIMKEAK